MKPDNQIIELLTQIRDLQIKQVEASTNNLEKASKLYQQQIENLKSLQQKFLKKVIIAIIIFLTISMFFINQ